MQNQTPMLRQYLEIKNNIRERFCFSASAIFTSFLMTTR
jgi:hypothetical protein